jgi:hypothetical protein
VPAARSGKRKLSVKTHFCDGHHIVKLEPAIWLYPSKIGLTGECHACFLFISGSTCGETGHLRLAPLLYQGGRRTNAMAEDEIAEYLERHQHDLPPALRIELERRSMSP